MQKITLVGVLVKPWLSNIQTDRHTDRHIYILTYIHSYIHTYRLLIEKFIQDENIENYKPEAILSLINSFTRENLQLALKDKSTLDLIKKY